MDRRDRRATVRAATSRRAAVKTIAGAALAVAARPRAAPATARVVVPTPDTVRAIYLDPRITSDRAGFDDLVDLIDRTELNALVLDIKEETVYYDTEVAFFQDAGAVLPRYDVADYLRTLKDHGIYTIARLVSFKDPITVEARPDLAIADETIGGVWRDGGGETWLNPFSEEVWEFTTDLAAEAAELGFDEVQFDYVRLPDGDLSAADFGPVPYTFASRTGAIAGFLEMGKEKVHDRGAKVSADIFGYTLLVEEGDDLGIGQDPAVLAPHVDALCPMIYPSHFPEGSLAVDGHPNDFPYETIEISLGLARERHPDLTGKLRPWLQDFSLPWLGEYDTDDVRAQIDATDEAGVAGWMLWDPNNVYHREALAPAE